MKNLKTLADEIVTEMTRLGYTPFDFGDFQILRLCWTDGNMPLLYMGKRLSFPYWTDDLFFCFFVPFCVSSSIFLFSV